MNAEFHSCRLDDGTVPRPLASALVRAGLGPAFHWIGELGLCARELRISVVGTREPGTASLAAIEVLASSLAMRGAVIVSGAARGTDMAAHRAALDAGGETIASLPRGLDALDVAEWRPVFARASSSRLLLLSVFEPRQPVTRQTPVIRNRLIAALGDALVVGEAQLASGTHTCTRVALELGVPVFFLTGIDTRDTQLATAHRSLQEKGAVAYEVDDAFGGDLPGRVLAAAAAHRKSRAAAEQAQLKLFE